MNQFYYGKMCFLDEERIELYDFEHSIYEDRYIVVGRVDKVLTIVYTERKDRIRIISARVATKEEEELYYDRT